MSFDIANRAVFNVGGVEVWITQTTINTWIIMGVLILFAVIVRIKLNSFKEKPTGFQNFVEMFIEKFRGFVANTAGSHMAYIGPWYFTIFTFLMLSNLSGIIGLRPPTADWSLTFPLAFVSFLLIQFAGFRYNTKSYIKGFFEPIFVFFPLNVIGELAKPISMSFRLFGNILGGMILVSMLYGIGPIFLQFFFPMVLHVYFDIVSGLLQAYVFTVLGLAFIGANAALPQEQKS